MGKNLKKDIYVYKQICMPERNTALRINYTTLKNKIIRRLWSRTGMLTRTSEGEKNATEVSYAGLVFLPIHSKFLKG